MPHHRSAPRRFARFLVAMVAMAGLAMPPGGAAQAQQMQSYIIGDDRGGPVGQRAREIERLRALGLAVEIRGQVCYSACTMYLGAENVCISPATIFGFHGPSDNGVPLDADAFERFSQLMARHYREPLRSWFLQTARYQRNGVLRISGADLLSMGYRAC